MIERRGNPKPRLDDFGRAPGRPQNYGNVASSQPFKSLDPTELGDYKIAEAFRSMQDQWILEPFGRRKPEIGEHSLRRLINQLDDYLSKCPRPIACPNIQDMLSHYENRLEARCRR